MRIALISPKSVFISKNKELSKFWGLSTFTEAYRKDWSGVSVGLCILASITPKEHDVEIIDENIEAIDFSVKYDLVGITCMTQQATRVYQIADRWKKQSVPVVIGGIHATILPEEVKDHADSVVIGEGENVWNELINDASKNELKPFYRSTQLTDLKKLPVPRYDLLRNKNYGGHWIQTTRGCPFNCNFCASSRIFGNKYRHKSIDQVIAEIEYLIRLYPTSRINFSDDNMFVNRKYARELLERITPYKIRYLAQTDISVAENSELLKLMKQSGCNILFIGIESLSEKNLEGIDQKNKKKKYLRKLPEYIKIIQSHGIGVMGAFITGLDDDDADVFDKIVEFSTKNVLYNTQITILTPFPGTELRERLLSEKRILNKPWEEYTSFDVTIKHPNITTDQFEEGIARAYKQLNSEEFYLKKLLHFKNIYTQSLHSQKG